MAHVTLPQVYPGAVSRLRAVADFGARAKYLITAADVATKIIMVAALGILGGIVRDMLGRIVVAGSAVAILLLILLLHVTTPTTTGPLGILIVFILMYVSALGVLTFLIYGISRINARLSRTLMVKRPFEALTLTRSYYFGSVIALVPVMIIGMQSVGEVGFYEIFLVGIFTIIACIYIAKRTS